MIMGEKQSLDPKTVEQELRALGYSDQDQEDFILRGRVLISALFASKELRTENAALKNALAQWEGEDGHGARWVKRVEVAEATIKARDERISEAEKTLDRSITFRLTTPTPPQQER